MSRRVSLPRLGLVVLTGAVAAVSFTISFHGLSLYGRDVMRIGGLDWLVPVGVDLASLVALVASHMRKSESWTARAYAWLVFVVTALLSIAGNLADGFARHLSTAGLVGVAAAPVVFALVSHLALTSWRADTAAEVPAEVSPAINRKVPAEGSASTGAEVPAEGSLVEGSRKPISTRPRVRKVPAKNARRPVAETVELARAAMAEVPAPTQAEVADRLGITSRRLREVLAEADRKVPAEVPPVEHVNGSPASDLLLTA